VHPTPLVHNENPFSEERDKELLMVADLAKASKMPVIVIGNVNDVAWSYTTTLFFKMSGLLVEAFSIPFMLPISLCVFHSIVLL